MHVYTEENETKCTGGTNVRPARRTEGSVRWRWLAAVGYERKRREREETEQEKCRPKRIERQNQYSLLLRDGRRELLEDVGGWLVPEDRCCNRAEKAALWRRAN